MFQFSNSTADVSDEESGSESQENKPQVVVLRKGDLTAEEAEQHVAELLKKEDDEDGMLNLIFHGAFSLRLSFEVVWSVV